MNSATEKFSAPDRDPGEAAAAWLARQDAGLTSSEAAQLEQWRTADPRNEAAWEDLASAWVAFDRVRETGEADAMVRELARRQHRRRWRRSIAIAAGLTAAAAAIVMIFVRPSAPDASAGVILRTERRLLDDGSVVELNRGAEIDVDYRSDRRAIRLVRGEAHFTVARNSARPFIVSTGRVDVQAVGTAFAVKLNDRLTDVLVTEGRVAVERSSPARGPTPPPAVLVDAGDRLLLPAVAPSQEVLKAEALSRGEMDQLLSWRAPWLKLSGTRLADAVVLLNHESRVQLRVADAKLAGLRLSGVFRADNAEGFARLLAANNGVELERTGDVIELRSR